MLAWLVHFLLAFFVATPAPKPQTPPRASFEVVKIVDGDTIDIKTATGSASVRFLGMDTPELATNDCLASDAKDKLTSLIGTSRVFLDADPTQADVDKYGRLLRYVSVDGTTDLSTQMLALGLAKYFTVGKAYAKDDQLKAAEKTAKDGKLGLWSPAACKPSGFCENVPVLMYHHIQPYEEAKKLGHAQLTVDSGWFEKQLAYLNNNHYTLLTAEQLITAIHTHQPLGKSVVITIDDAYDDTFNYAYPLLQKYGAVASLFVPTGLVGNSGYLNWGQVTQMNAGNLKAYNHTWSHYSLPAGSAIKDTTEITQAQTQLEEHLGTVPRIFAYPYGSHNAADIALLKQQNFQGAFTTTAGRWQCEGNLFTLPRIRVGNANLSSYGL